MQPEAIKNEEWTLPVEGANDLRVRTPNGGIRVEGGDDATLSLRAEIKVRADTEADARAFLEQIRIERRRDGDTWHVEATWPRPVPREVRGVQASLALRAPRGFRLQGHSGHGSLEASDMADTRLETGNGGVRAHRIGGRLTVRSGHGSIEAAGCAGEVEVETGNGGVTVREAPGAIRVKSGHGSISVTAVGETRIETGNGGVNARDVRGPLKAHTGHGSISVENCSSEVTADSGNGGMTVRDVPGRVAVKSGHGSIEVERVGESRLHTGNGGVTAREVAGALHVRTGHGSLAVEGCAGDADVETHNGGVTLRGVAGAVRARTGHGSARVDAGRGPVEVESGNGSIDLALLAGVSAHIEAETGGGGVEMTPPGAATVNPRRTRLEARLGDGEHAIRLRTGHGPIRIRLAEER